MIKSCTRCLVTSDVYGSTFNENQLCNYCSDFTKSFEESKIVDHTKKSIEELINDVKKNMKGKYDSIIGISGGVDSSWVAVKAKQLGLNPLIVHMDNGWNSELAQNNIEKLITKLDLDLYSYVIDWKEYRKLMLAFLEADVIDIELLYDNAVHGTLFRLAKKFKIKYILMGTNLNTEGMIMPESWNWNKWDKKNIKSIGKKFQNVKIYSYPLFGLKDYFFMKHIYRIKTISFLDYLNYDKNYALNELQLQYEFKPYPYKHYESIFTRFYQGYILPNKFKVDKRIFHLSNLVLTNQMTIDEARERMKESPYPVPNDLNSDISYFLKKIGWQNKDLEEYLKRPQIDHKCYPSNVFWWKLFKKFYSKYNNYKFIKYIFRGQDYLYK
jgi:N-acetyl sugar amidotransferase